VIKSDFDIDLKNGVEAEEALHNILNMDTVEVKRDFKWFETGNLYIETECYFNKSGSWEPSGLAVTKATHWAIALGDTNIIVPTQHIKDLIAAKEKYGVPRKVSCNIEPNPSRGYLITVDDILFFQAKQGSDIKYRKQD
jgi:hypothetical protein